MNNLSILLGMLLLTGQVPDSAINLSNVENGEITLKFNQAYVGPLINSPFVDQENLHISDSHHFSYDHQDNWLFETGKMQSPIDIDTSIVELSNTYHDPIFNFDTTVQKVADTGHSIELDLDGESILMNREFDLMQIHFHAPSEHTVDGQYSDLEAHFVHAGEDGRLAVVGVLFNLGEENVAFEELLDEVEDEDLENGFEIAIDTFLPDDLSAYHYIGSLTTPPLAENVEWYILAEQLEISEEQLNRFNKFYKDNNRDIQDLNDRVIKYIHD
ncbi:carbonic anhydrase family protein [Candidatus Epulonipiscium viviparus]|uniref:carbonic anhydrase family protein n=1 Tax=Candidatus Epulonipiscium viviparus TaxID=420336 RepID=UPI002738133F|nr:carbonic anhydrase family protein [Candidatus Epulopiscium viviparus]